MALPLAKTLAEIRRAVLIRCGMATAGSVPSRIVLMVDELIRAAHAELFTAFVWTRNTVRLSQVLVEGQSQYELPAELVAGGSILRVVITRDDGQTYDLKQDERTFSANIYGRNADGTVANGVPRIFRMIEGVLEINPPPNNTVTTITLEAVPGPSELVSDDARPVVDDEALIQRATIKVLDHVGTRGTAELNLTHRQYLNQLRSRQRPAMAFALASDDISGPGYWYLASRYPNTRPFAPDWNPW